MEGTMLRRKHERKVRALGAFSLVTLLMAGCGGGSGGSSGSLQSNSGNNTAIASSRWVHLGAYPVAFVSTDQNYYGRGIAFDPVQGNPSGIYPGVFI
jgi:hypothetical protein